MDVSLTPRLEAFVGHRVDPGPLNGASELARKALELLARAKRGSRGVSQQALRGLRKAPGEAGKSGKVPQGVVVER